MENEKKKIDIKTVIIGILDEELSTKIERIGVLLNLNQMNRNQ
tara:strand:- start:208 stop:336 length:129 start_codon:yes stop_codon:yes gene_type:complete